MFRIPSNRVIEYSSEGAFLRTFGSAGTGNGQFESAKGIGIPSGNLYVVDRGNNRVEVFKPNGEFLTKFGTAGAGNGNFSEPRAIAFGAAGAIFVTDKGNNRVHKWGPVWQAPPTFISAFGSTGSGTGQLNGPRGVAADGKGHVWIVDRANDRVEEFNESGEYLTKFGTAGSGNGQLNNPWGIAITPAGNLWVADTGNERLEEFNSKGEFIQKFGTKAPAGSQRTELLEPEGIAVTSTGMLWISDCSGNRVAEFRETVTSESERFVRNASGTAVNAPVGVAVDGAGDVWVAEETVDHLLEFSPEGSFIRSVGSSGSGNGQLDTPEGVGVGPSGNVYVADLGNDRVDVFNPGGEFLTKFGAAGTGNGNFTEPKAIAFGAGGAIFVSDKGNNRVHRWGSPWEGSPTFISAFGSTGSGTGQLNGPRGVAADGKGHVWIVDRANDRVEEFKESGEYLGQFGSSGSGNGQFNEPWGIAVTPAGNIWVVDTENRRVEEFNPEGKFLQKFGTKATGASKGTEFVQPEGIAVAPNGMIWVADNSGARIAEFRESVTSESERFVRNVATTGTGNPGLANPLGLAVDASGNLWATDETANRVIEYSSEGAFLRTFGSAGTGNGQFESAKGIGIGPSGNLYVVDRGNNRVEVFKPNGEFLTKFGTAGAGNGNFSEPRAIAFGAAGAIFVTDKGNNRVHKWGLTATLLPGEEEVPVKDDPAVEITTASGLVTTAQGSQAGQITYQHSGQLLTEAHSLQGETHYEYDSGERLKRITLPNGTWAEITYEELGRVKSVVVSIEGAKAKTTHFEYSNEPRRTVVTPDAEQATTFDIGEDGSVLKWQNALEPPEIEEMEGSLWAQRGEVHPEPISIGDQNLHARAYSPEGIASIEIIANNDQLVAEKTCEKEHVSECIHLEKEFVTETENWPPGVLQLEVLATDRLEQVVSKRFWDNNPRTPPPGSEAPNPPTFEETLRFREEFGLDLDIKGNAAAINERIFELINAWHSPNTPLGEFARASAERWGVPMRPVDVAEMEYREWFYNLNAERIDQWVEETEPSSFAGYYIDHAAGGIMHIGFTNNQTEQLESLEASLSLVGGNRLQAYPVSPTASYLSVKAASESVSAAIEANSSLSELVVSVNFDESGKAIRIRTPNVAKVESLLKELLGSSAPIVVEYETAEGSLLSGRFRNEGRMRAGDAIFTEHYTSSYPSVHDGNVMCTAGFGAKDKAGENGGRALWRLFVLTAGHCNQVAHPDVYRSTDSDSTNESHWKEVGEVRRTSYQVVGESPTTDAEAIRVESAGIVPQGIFGTGGNLRPTEPAATAKKGEVVCFSGATAQGVSCGPIVGRTSFWAGVGDGAAHAGYWVKFPHPAGHGDSGAPVYSASGQSIGLVEAGRNKGLTETLVQPLLTPPGMNSAKVPGILNNPHLRPLSLKLGADPQ